MESETFSKGFVAKHGLVKENTQRLVVVDYIKSGPTINLGHVLDDVHVMIVTSQSTGMKWGWCRVVSIVSSDSIFSY